jgi:Family of unknown function (DUF6035)
LLRLFIVMTLNITIKPDSYSEPAHDIAIKEVLNCNTGEFIDSRKLIYELRHDEIVRHRVAVRERWRSENPIYRCALCNVPVALLTNPQKRWFFRHSTEDCDCPAKTKSALNHEEIQARKFNGVKESDPHKKIKRLLMEGLEADPSFSNVATEKLVLSYSDTQMRRRPDVQANYGGTSFAFEIQLSTTFLDVIIGRKTFYRDEGWQLLWVLPMFSPDYRRMVEDDILFTNNSNIFVINEETTELSIKMKTLHLLCWYLKPKRVGNNIVSEWCSKLIGFNQITFEKDMQRAFYYDFEATAEKVRLEVLADEQIIKRQDALLENELQIKATENKQKLLDKFENFWINRKMNSPWTSQDTAVWDDLRLLFKTYQIDLPELPTRHVNFEKFLYSVYSAKHGKPIGWDFENLLSVAHNIAQFHQSQLLPFGYALNFYGNKVLLNTLDRKGKWSARQEYFKEEIKSLNQIYMPDWSLQPIIKFIFPEIHQKLKSFYNKNREQIELNTQLE